MDSEEDRKPRKQPSVNMNLRKEAVTWVLQLRFWISVFPVQLLTEQSSQRRKVQPINQSTKKVRMKESESIEAPLKTISPKTLLEQELSWDLVLFRRVAKNNPQRERGSCPWYMAVEV